MKRKKNEREGLMAQLLQSGKVEIGQLLVGDHNTATQNYYAKEKEEEFPPVEATSKDVAAAVRGCAELMYAPAAMTVVYAVCRDVCHWEVGQTDFERMMTLEGLECRNGVLANTLRNNPYMRDNISKWAALGAREAVLKLRDALCESLRAGAAT